MVETADAASTVDRGRANESLTKGDWIAGAWEMLGETGLDGVRVEPLAKRLGVTKGSFYWHFKDRQELLDALFDRWFSIGEDYLSPNYGHGENAADRIWKLFESVIGRTTRGQTVTLRLFSHKDPDAARRIEDRDAQRLAFLIRELKEIGFPHEEARVRGQIYQAIMTGEFLRSGGLPFEERIAHAREYHLLLSTKIADVD